MGVRRVVTGHNDEGKAIFASDEIVEPTTLSLLPGAEFFQLWGIFCFIHIFILQYV